MFDPKLTFLDEKESKDEMKKVRGGKQCYSFVNRYAPKCTEAGAGCISAVWSKVPAT